MIPDVKLTSSRPQKAYSSSISIGMLMFTQGSIFVRALPVELHRHNQNKRWLRTESNRRHKDFQSFALPTELLSHLMAVWTGLEPATSCVTGRHSNQLNYQTIFLILIVSKETGLANHLPTIKCQ